MQSTIREKSDGRLDITFYPGGALGFKESDMLRVMQAGTIEMAVISTPYITSDCPELGYIECQGMLKDKKDEIKIIPVVNEIAREVLDEWDIHFIGLGHLEVWDTYLFSKKPVRSLQEMKGQKYRVWTADQEEVGKRLGLNPQLIPAADVYMGLKTGLIDSALFGLPNSPPFKLFEVSKNCTNFAVHNAACHMLIVASKQAWNALPSDLQILLMEEYETWDSEITAKIYSSIEEIDGPTRKMCEEEGMTFYALNEEDRELVRETSMQVWEDLSKEHSVKAYANYEKIRAVLGY